MNESRKVFIISILIISVVVVLTLTGSTFLLYQTAIDEQKKRLYEFVDNQAMFVHVFHEATSLHGNDMELSTHIGHANELQEFFEALREQSTKTNGESDHPTLNFFIAERKDDFTHYYIGPQKLISKPVPFAMLAENPMGRALTGQSDVLRTKDHMGNDILCSYTFVESVGVGIVAKILIQDIQRPFIRTGLLTFWGSFLLVIICAFIIKFTVTPLTRRLEKQRQKVEEINKSLTLLATTDHLTGLYNRKYFSEQLESAAELANRHSRDIAIILFDIDHFKEINDSYGHPKGDDILKELSLLIKTQIRKTDILARWGGEEFIILVQEDPLDTAQHLAQKLQVALSKENFTLDRPVTCSFGVTTFVRDESVQSFIKRADEALYEAKGKGRNTVIVQ